MIDGLVLFGGGNITRSRHLPALRSLGITPIGIVGTNSDHVQRAARQGHVANTAVIPGVHLEQELASASWLKSAKAALIGTPPQTHYELARHCLSRGLHVLVEKPMTLSSQHSQELQRLALERGLTLNVMHNFQYASGAKKLFELTRDGALGDISSFHLVQNTSRNRRLPDWYQELPLGLFFDECSHFFYMAKRFGGSLQVHNANAVFNSTDDTTPHLITSLFHAGDVPCMMTIDFNAPICEWFFIVHGSNKTGIYDYFRDILIVIASDGQHYAQDIARTSLSAVIGHGFGFLKSGVRLVTGRLLYGVDDVIREFAHSIQTGRATPEVSAQSGVEVTQAMSTIVSLVEQAR